MECVLRRTLTVLAVLATSIVAPAGAASAACPPAGGGQQPSIPAPAAGAAVSFAGRGYGHGVGMSQYGSLGAAQKGCDHAQILTTYFPGTTVSGQASPSVVRVGMEQATGSTTFIATSEQIPWTLELCAQGTPPSGWPNASCSGDTTVPPQPVGVRRTVSTDGYGVFKITDKNSAGQIVGPSTDSNGQPAPWTGGNAFALLTARHDGKVLRISDVNRNVRWGDTVVDSTSAGGGSIYVVLYIDAGPDGFGGTASAMNRYLWGLAEVPRSWPSEALKVQAVAGRSYAAKRTGGTSYSKTACRCDLYTDTRDQHYVGWGQEELDRASTSYPQAWKKAVDQTSDKILRYGSSIADTFYSSSHGGWSEASAHIWGGDVAYLQAVDTSGWEAGTPAENSAPAPFRGSYLGWRRDYSAASIRSELAEDFTSSRCGSGFSAAEIVEMAVVARGPGGHPTTRDLNGDGRPDGVKVAARGTNGTTCTIWYSGEAMRIELGLLSNNFSISFLAALSNGGVPIVGDWDGDGDDEPGWYRDGIAGLQQADGSTRRVGYGVAGDRPIVGDWNGDGVDTLGVLRGNRWLLTNDPDGGMADHDFRYGYSTDRQLVGDWDGNGVDTPGVVRGNRWFLTNTLTGGNSDYDFRYGYSTDTVVVGDWDGNATDTAGVIRGNRWLLTDGTTGGFASRDFRYGTVSDTKVLGDWNGDGLDTAGVVRDRLWYLTDSHQGGNAQRTVDFGG